MKTPNEVKSWVDMLLSRRPNVEDRNYLETIKVYMDKVERPQGEWITENLVEPYGKCNQCGEICEVDNFCGNCGADMRGG